MENKRLKVGTIGVASRDLQSFMGIIEQGSPVQVVDVDEYDGYSLMELETGIRIVETGYDSIVPVSSKLVSLAIGTIGVTSRELKALTGVIPEGASVEIVGMDASMGYDVTDRQTGVTLVETGFDSVIPTQFEKEESHGMRR